jgi:hypothetical protein
MCCSIQFLLSLRHYGNEIYFLVEQTQQLIVDVLRVILLDIRPIASSHLWFCHKRRHDTQPNDVQHNDTQRKVFNEL